MAFLLAAQALARRAGWAERRRLAGAALAALPVFVAALLVRPEDRLEAEERLRAEDALDREALAGEPPREVG